MRGAGRAGAFSVLLVLLLPAEGFSRALTLPCLAVRARSASLRLFCRMLTAGRALYFPAPGQALVLRSPAHAPHCSATPPSSAQRSSTAVGERQWLSAHRRRQHTALFASSGEVWCLRATQHSPVRPLARSLEILMASVR